MSNTHPIYLLTTRIETERDVATGFFYKESAKLYLVTNKHVVYGKEFSESGAKPKIERITVLLHTDPNDFTKNEKVMIDLFSGNEKIWLEHSDHKLDVILIPLVIDEKKYVFSKIDRSFIDDADNLLIQFEKILIVGYPCGWYDDVYNLPIVRVGHLSSPFKVSFRGEPVMVGDAITHPGMSGSPVMMVLRDPITKEEDGKLSVKTLGTKYLLIGIYSGQYKIPDNERPNLINIWFAEIIKAILAENLK
jgi:hypothetical protein